MKKFFNQPSRSGSMAFMIVSLFALSVHSTFAQRGGRDFADFMREAQQGGGGSEVREAAQQVTAVADEYSNSLIILAPESFQESISNLVVQLDVSVQDITELRVFTLQNADPAEMAEVLNGLFEDQSSSANARGPGVRFGRGGRDNQNNGDDQSQRAQAQSKVVAVPDARTSSILVSASKNLMEQIAPMIEELDQNTSKKQKVFVYSLENAGATEVETVLRNLFESQDTRNARGGTQNNQQNDALQQRQNNAARNQGTTTATGFGGGGGLGGGATGGN